MRHVLVIAVLAACGSPSPSKMDAKAADAPKVDAMKDAPSIPTLTVENYSSWCAVTIGTDTASTLGVVTMPITASGPITLKASPSPTGGPFEISGNLWHHTDGDTGSGDPGVDTGSGQTEVSTATVTVTAGMSKCVWICCPFVGGTGCSVPEQCH